MNNNFSNTSSTPILGHLTSTYKFWNNIQPHIPKASRYGLGLKIEVLFSETLEYIFSASYATKEEKIRYLRRASSKIDLLKFFLTILWETKKIDNKKYIEISEKLVEIGRMLGGWQRQLLSSASQNLSNR